MVLDRGFIDGETISFLKKERGVDVIIPLRSDMLAYEDSLTTAYHSSGGSWEGHPTIEGQEIKHIEHVEWMCGQVSEGR